jgi:hypothetical protein
MDWFWKKLDHFATRLSNLCWRRLYKNRSKQWLKEYKKWRKKETQ